MVTDNSLLAIAAAIERHCAKHPHAADTVEGVRRWWLAPQEIETTLIATECALEQLAHQGRVSRRILPDGTTIYFCCSSSCDNP